MGADNEFPSWLNPGSVSVAVRMSIPRLSCSHISVPEPAHQQQLQTGQPVLGSKGLLSVE